MAVSVNENTARAQLYTGLVSMKIVAVNPTLEELKTRLGKPAEKEPVYVSEVDSKRTPGTPVKQTRLEFHFEAAIDLERGIAEPIVARNSLFTRYEYIPGMMINRFGRFAGSNNPEALEKLSESDGQPLPAFDGEMDVMMLLESICNPKKGEEFRLDYRKQLFFNGYLDELRNTLRTAAKNSVQCLLGVQTDANGRHYQTVFRNVVAGWQTSYANLHKQYLRQREYIKDTDFGPIGDEYYANDFTLRKWSATGSSQPATELAGDNEPYNQPAPKPRLNNPGPPEPAPIASDDDNDLPF